MWKTQHFSMVTACKKDLFSTFPFRQNDDERMAGDSLFCWISGIIGTSEKKGGFRMPQSEMEAFIQLQNEVIESKGHLEVASQCFMIEQMSRCPKAMSSQ